MDALRRSGFVQELLEGRLALEWAPTRMVSDDPAKGLGLAAPETLLPQKLAEIIGEPTAGVDLVSAYFVPAAADADALAALAARGVKVRVLTNSLEATDLAVVHAGYAKRRKFLLATGITLYEFRRLPSDTGAYRRTGLLGGSGSSGSSALGLHAKTLAVDWARVFIGSFNFDPRSATLNTEMGFVIDSPALARRSAEAFDSTIPANAYEVRLSDSGELYWLERRGEQLVRHDTEPGTGFWRRAGVWLLSLLPIEWLL